MIVSDCQTVFAGRTYRTPDKYNEVIDYEESRNF